MLILCLNRGSSTLRYAAYELADRYAAPVLKVRGTLRGRAAGVADLTEQHRDTLVRRMLGQLTSAGLPRPDIIVHRLVRGPQAHDFPAWLNADYLERLRSIADLAPLHLPPALAVIDACTQAFGDSKQAVCFDTAFHQGMPRVATRLPLPTDVLNGGERYGFHGLSYEYVTGKIGPSGRTVIAHLGGGASMAAVKDGVPIDTSMGFSPIGGMMMGTRSGDLDPGLMIYLLRHRGFSVDALEKLVAERAGLLGVSGASADMGQLLANYEFDADAKLAVELFCYLAGKQLGAMVWALGGLDTLVFTGGIGENAALVRTRICNGAGFLGIDIDASRNANNDSVISTDASRCRVRIIPTDEQWMMAQHVQSLLVRETDMESSPQEATGWTN